MKAVSSDLAFVQGCCPSSVYRSVWDRLCQQLFGAMPAGMIAEDQISNVDIWKDGVSLTVEGTPATFTIISDDDDTPKAGDVILYKGKYYIIGAVE